eukprot:5957321-Amphidinium_carterae.1
MPLNWMFSGSKHDLAAGRDSVPWVSHRQHPADYANTQQIPSLPKPAHFSFTCCLKKVPRPLQIAAFFQVFSVGFIESASACRMHL